MSVLRVGVNVTVRMSAPMCRHVSARKKVSAPVSALGCADTCRHVLTYECYLEAGMCWHVSAPRRCPPLGADTFRCRHVPTPAGMCQHINVPAQVSTHLRADTCRHVLTYECYWNLGCADMCQHLEGADTSRCRHVPTPLGADTCRHLWYQSYELYLDTGMCWQMPAPGKVPTPRKVPTRAGMCQEIKVPAQVSTHLPADTCQHVLTYECYLEAGMCWHVSAPRRCRHL